MLSSEELPSASKPQWQAQPNPILRSARSRENRPICSFEVLHKSFVVGSRDDPRTTFPEQKIVPFEHSPLPLTSYFNPKLCTQLTGINQELYSNTELFLRVAARLGERV